MKYFSVGDIVKLNNPRTKNLVGMEFRILKRMCDNYFYIFCEFSHVALHVHANELDFVRKTDSIDTTTVAHELFSYLVNEEILDEDQLHISGINIYSDYPFAPYVNVYVLGGDDENTFMFDIEVGSIIWKEIYVVKSNVRGLHKTYRVIARCIKEGISNCK